jgi:hypothetical protein
MPIDARTACLLHLAYLKAYTAAGKRHVMEFAEYMQDGTDTLADELQPFGKLLTKIWMEVLTESFVENLQLFVERGFQEIARVREDSQGNTPSSGCPSQQEAAKSNWRE